MAQASRLCHSYNTYHHWQSTHRMFALWSPARFTISTTPPERKDSERPGTVDLNQNCPNPFNPTTQITYELPQQSDVTLQVFDLTGRQVAILVNEQVNAGTHTANFDASNLSSGVYVYRLQAGSVVLSRKLTLIK